MKGALLVDLDGTLIDTHDANFSAYDTALREIGITVSRVEFDAVAKGRNWRQFLPIILGNAAIDPGVVARRKLEIYPQMLHLTVVNDGVSRLVALANTALATALVTTASAASAKAVLSYHKLHGLFDVIVTGNDVTHHKPHPEAYQLAAEKLGVEAKDCVVIEDSDAGVASARAFGATVIRVNSLA